MRVPVFACAIAAAELALLLRPPDSSAAGILIQTFDNMSALQSSPLYSYIMGSPGGPAASKPQGVRGVRQGTTNVPTTSAGAPGNTTVTSEIVAAASDLPDVLSLNASSSYYNKKFVSLGNDAGGQAPFLTLDIAPAASAPTGGFNGYDIVVFDLGKNLASGSGNANTEATTFSVELISSGQVFTVGTVNSTGGNFINAILLDITGIAGIPYQVDAVRITDRTGSSVSTSGGIDLDGALTLNLASTTPVAATSWGRVKSLYR